MLLFYAIYSKFSLIFVKDSNDFFLFLFARWQQLGPKCRTSKN